MKKLMLLVAGGVGYVLGTRAGRERYDQIKKMATRVKDDPRVQERAHQAADVTATTARTLRTSPTSRTNCTPTAPRGRTTPTRRATSRSPIATRPAPRDG